ncbi:hypothetical protein [Actinoplanes derwentensis]|uniref:Uncharacterized protein n=1 Tax=Actinoplanes derwentensis TaxID=113562 RepID=A0A1H1XXF8_9ACTN|nr:hypothetical protein [Actinoplanes derwentensis]GID90286.1 hypothetical protein Ade03nite_92100 [Actinoplanes derwentensis]SDT13589.1 hypothetical protein SAMN04489716_2616 [Actinoplanes derwentensis]
MVNLDDLRTLYNENHKLVVSAAFLTGLGLILLVTHRIRRRAEHRLTLLVANILTVIAAALATMVSASGMWKFFTDILGQSPLRIVFFAYIEVALFASALLARARLLREPEKGTTGVDGVAVWVFAGLTAGLSALDASSFRELCLRLAAPPVAAWMWERALAAERSVRLGRTMSSIHWTVTVERILVWLRLAEAQDRDVTEVDRARRRARLGRARLRLYTLQNKKAATWRIRRAHNRVIRHAMHAAEHIGLADFPGTADEREAMQIYMATLYGVVDATSPEAVARFNAWRLSTSNAPTPTASTGLGPAAVAPGGPEMIATAKPARQPVPPSPADLPSETAAEGESPQQPHDEFRLGPGGGEEMQRDHNSARWPGEHPGAAGRSEPWTAAPHDPYDDPDEDHDEHSGDEEADRSAVAAMRRFWDSEIAQGRVPTGAELSRATGVPPSTGLGRRKRREWEVDLPDHIRVTATAGR